MMPIRYRAVLFDFDGTLADSYDAITASVNHVRSQRGLAAMPQQQVRKLVGHGLLQLMADIVPGGDSHANAELYRLHHPTVMYQHTRLLAGVAAALKHLHQAGVRLGVCSNKPAVITKQLLVALGLTDYIPLDAAFGPEDAEKPKPDPGMVMAALTRLGVTRDQALYVGDMPVDIETGRNAGLTVWVVATGSSDVAELREAKPDRLLHSMTELVPALASGDA
jgi:2-phosphoglycolate phosphatase